MTQQEFESRINSIKENAKKLNAVVTFKQLIGKDYLDCLWYGGEVGTIQFTDGKYKGYTLVIGAYGDVRIDGEIDGEIIEVTDKQNLGRFYDGCGYILNDEKLHKLCDWTIDSDDILDIFDGNWFEVNVIKPNGEYVDLCAADNVLDDDLLGNFEHIDDYYTYIDWVIDGETIITYNPA